MLVIVLSTLFAAAAVFAISVIASSWRRHGQAALSLRSELAHCPAHRDVAVRITDLAVRKSATVLRPSFTARPGPRPTAAAA